MKEILCEMKMFNFRQNIWVYDAEKNERNLIGSFTLSEMPEAVCELCKEMDINSVVLTCGITSFASAYQRRIQSHANLNYSNNNIKVKVV